MTPNSNGWFPHFSVSGKIASGETSGGGIYVEGQRIAVTGWRPRWIDDVRVAFNAGNQQHGIWNGATVEYVTPGFSVTPGGGGKYVGWAQAPPFEAFLNGNTSIGVNVGEPWVSRRGDYVFPTDFRGEAHAIILNGREIVPARRHLVDPRTEDGLVVWSEYRSIHGRQTYGWRGGAIEDLGLFDPVGDADIHNEFSPIPLMTPRGPFVFHGTHWGAVVRPWGSRLGYVLVGELYFPDAICLGDRVFLVGSNAGGAPVLKSIGLDEAMVDVLERARQIVGAPPVVVVPPVVVPPKPEVPAVSVPDLSGFASAFLGPRLALVGGEDDTRAHSFAAVNAGCVELRKADPRWGLLEKTGGAQVRDRAADVWLYDLGNGTAQVVDVVANAEGAPENGTRKAPRPAWGLKDIRPISQWREPYPVEAADPVPQDPPKSEPAGDSLAARVEALAAAVDDLQDSQDSDRLALEELRAARAEDLGAIEVLRAALVALEAAAIRSGHPVEVEGSIGLGAALKGARVKWSGKVL
jgi:hypothetical protein